MSVTEKTFIGTIDLTPTWKQVLPLLLMGYEEGSSEGRALALEELQRMAEAADAYVGAQKALREASS